MEKFTPVKSDFNYLIEFIKDSEVNILNTTETKTEIQKRFIQKVKENFKLTVEKYIILKDDILNLNFYWEKYEDKYISILIGIEIPEFLEHYNFSIVEYLEKESTIKKVIEDIKKNTITDNYKITNNEFKKFVGFENNYQKSILIPEKKEEKKEILDSDYLSYKPKKKKENIFFEVISMIFGIITWVVKTLFKVLFWLMFTEGGWITILAFVIISIVCGFIGYYLLGIKF